jgi:hypothetical protein
MVHSAEVISYLPKQPKRSHRKVAGAFAFLFEEE